MAFDPSLDALALAGDLSGISDEYLCVSILAAAVGCITRQQAEWWDSEVMPDENVFRVVESFFDDDGNETPEISSDFLLLVWAVLTAERQ
ncbi:hypothetical protein D9M72_345190 [compost metagenome]